MKKGIMEIMIPFFVFINNFNLIDALDMNKPHLTTSQIKSVYSL